MAAAAGPNKVWVWHNLDDDAQAFEHPSDIPNNEATAEIRWVQNKRGPRLARIQPATLINTAKSDNGMVTVAERGVISEVRRSRLLPWFEGLLLLDAIENRTNQNGRIQADWHSDADLQEVLEQERKKFNFLSGALYTEKRLLSQSVTGESFLDKSEREWNYRRDNVSDEDKSGLVDGEATSNLFKVKAVTGYLPPWEAFCSDKCGFYQDFYLVQWEAPYSEVDYAQVENGCSTTVGATWEPDECLPACLDPYRVSSKKAWCKKQVDKENEWKLAEKRATPPPAPSPPKAIKRPKLEHDSSKKVVKEEHPPPQVKLARFGRGGRPLVPDQYLHCHGHDFDVDAEGGLIGIRAGWPQRPEDYPAGYRVSNPPGFCWEGCDCMDDQRPQRSWEMHKGWLDDALRVSQAKESIERFAQQTHLVRRRGQVSKMCYFESMSKQDQRHDKHGKAAVDLAGSIGRRIAEVLQRIPFSLLAEAQTDPVPVPALTFLPADCDIEPLKFEGKLKTGEPLPDWLRLDSGRGTLHALPCNPITEDLHFNVDFHNSAGVVGTAQCVILQGRPPASLPWMVATGNIIARMNNAEALDKCVRSVLYERMAPLYDFPQRVPRNVTLGMWLRTITVVQRMLRSTAVAVITPNVAPAV